MTAFQYAVLEAFPKAQSAEPLGLTHLPCIKVPDCCLNICPLCAEQGKQTASSAYLSTPSQFSLAQVLKDLQCQFIRQLDIKERNLIYFILKRKKIYISVRLLYCTTRYH